MIIRSLPERATAAALLAVLSAAPVWALDAAPKLVQQEACVRDVLKKTSDVKILVAKAPPEQMAVGTFYNFVDYQSQGWGLRVQVSRGSDGNYRYMTMVSGFGSDPQAHGTNAINQSWKSACGAATIIFFP